MGNAFGSPALDVGEGKMKNSRLQSILTIAYIAGTAVIILYLLKETASLKSENEALRDQLADPEITELSDAVLFDAQANTDGQDSSNKLSEENERLNEELSQLREVLTKAQGREELLQEKLDELLKPLDKDILSSTLKAKVNKDEVLVTGGYQTADGRFQYSMVKPKLVQLPDGREAIQLKSIQYAISPEVMKEFGLDSLSTGASNILQHGEIWTAEELKAVRENMGRRKGVGIMSAPSVTVLSGKKATLTIGEYQMTTTPNLSDDGTGFDIELRIEQPREPQKTPNQPGGGNAIGAPLLDVS